MGRTGTRIRYSSLLTAIMLCAGASPVRSAPPQTVRSAAPQEDALIGRLDNGGRVLLVGSDAKGWGIRVEAPGMASVTQLEPVRARAYQSETDITDLAAAYRSIRRSGDDYVCVGQLAPVDGVALRFEDTWSVTGEALHLSRSVRVEGTAHGGFYSAVTFTTDSLLLFPDADHFAPGTIYGGPQYLSDRAPAGMVAFKAGRYQIREDGFPLPVYGLHFRDGTSVAVLDPSPNGATTAADSHDARGITMIDKRFQFGALGEHETPDERIELGYWFPGSMAPPPVSGPSTAPRPNEPGGRRYHPFQDGFTQQYRLEFRFGRDETFHDFYTHAWRWGWSALHPELEHYDMAMMQRILADQLTSTIRTVDGRTALPFWYYSTTGKIGDQLWFWNAIMGFVGKNIEGAALLLQQAEGDNSPRGQRQRKLALAIIDTFVREVKVAPPSGEGFNLNTGAPAVTRADLFNAVHLRALTDDMIWALEAYQRELKDGHEHANWLLWCREFGEWLLGQQRPDGSFPRSWQLGNGKIFNGSSTSTYNAIAFLVELKQVTGQERFLTAAERAGEFTWLTYDSHDAFVGGTLDNPNILDKEAGTLSLQGYLALYEETHDARWLRRARAAADFAETWIYAWNVPMPVDEPDSVLRWKRGANTTGVNKINSTAFFVDQWMAGDVDEYARLYQHTGDRHYLTIARILMHNTKNMVGIPGRTWDLHGPGWQQEGWSMVRQRGVAGQIGWLPWVTVNHLEGILALEAYDENLYRQVAGGGR